MIITVREIGIVKLYPVIFFLKRIFNSFQKRKNRYGYGRQTGMEYSRNLP